MTSKVVDVTEAGEPNSATSLSLLQFAVPTSNCTALNNFESTSSRSTLQSTSKQLPDVVDSWQLVAMSDEQAEAEERGSGEEDTRYFEPASLDLSDPYLGPFDSHSSELIPPTLTLQQRPSSSSTGKVTEPVAANARKAGNLSGGKWTSTEIAELLVIAEQVRAVTGTIGMTGWVKVASKMGTERSAKAVMRKYEYEMRKLEGRGTGRKSTRGPDSNYSPNGRGGPTARPKKVKVPSSSEGSSSASASTPRSASAASTPTKIRKKLELVPDILIKHPSAPAPLSPTSPRKLSVIRPAPQAPKPRLPSLGIGLSLATLDGGAEVPSASPGLPSPFALSPNSLLLPSTPVSGVPTTTACTKEEWMRIGGQMGWVQGETRECAQPAVQRAPSSPWGEVFPFFPTPEPTPTVHTVALPSFDICPPPPLPLALRHFGDPASNSASPSSAPTNQHTFSPMYAPWSVLGSAGPPFLPPTPNTS